MPTAEMELQQQHQHTTLDVPPVAGKPPRVEGEGSSEPAGNAPQVAAGDGGSEHSVGTQDLQTTRILIDIGDNRIIEITLRGNATLQSIGPQTATGGGGGTAAAAAAPRPSTGQRTVLSPQASDDQQFLDNKRGWLTTVATLFIGISFQAAMQPPSWIPEGKGASGAPSPTTPAPSPSHTAAAAAASTISHEQAHQASLYMFNTMTLAISLAMVVLLLASSKIMFISARALAVMAASLCITLSLTFAFGNSYGPRDSWKAILILVAFCYAAYSVPVFWNRLRFPYYRLIDRLRLNPPTPLT